MKRLIADGWHEERLLIDAAATAMGGGAEAAAMARRVFDAEFRIWGAA